MTCDEVELALVTGEPLPNEAKEHLSSCDKCSVFARDAAQVIQDAALPPVSASEKAALQGLAPRVHHAWKQKQRSGGIVRRFAGLAIAACLGAAVTYGALLPSRVTQQQPQRATTSEEIEWPVSGSELPVADSADDELEFEVGWPTNADTN